MPSEFWVDACQAGVYIRNRIGSGPTVNDHLISPHEAFTGKVPSVDHIRVWGCKVHSYMERESIPQGFRRDKLMDKSRIGVFVGYVGDTSKQFLIWAPDRRDVIKSSNVVFHEDQPGGEIDLKFQSQHASSTAPDRNARGRPRLEKETEPLRPLRDLPDPPGRRSVGAEAEVNDPTWKPTSVGADVPTTDWTTRTTSQEETPGLIQEEKPEWEVPANWKPTQKVEVVIPLNPLKRAREEDPAGQEDERAAKMHRALIALLAASGVNSVAKDEVEDTYQEVVDLFQLMTCEAEMVESAFSATGKGSIPIPQNYHEAIMDKVWGEGWKEAIKKELIALATNQT